MTGVLTRSVIEQTNATAAITRANLGLETLSAIQGYDWQADPSLNLYCKITADQNFAMANLRDCVWARLKIGGHQITLEDRDFDPIARFLYRQAATEQKRLDAAAIAAAEIVSYLQVEALKQRENRTPEQEQAISRYHLCDFYAIAPDSLTPEFVLWDADGRRRGELLNLESMLHPNVAIDATTRALENQMAWNQGLTPWDISGAALRQEVRRLIGLDNFLDPNREWTADDCLKTAEFARSHRRQIKDVLHFDPSPKISNVQIVHQLLSQLGLKIAFRWQGTHGNGKHRVYRLELETWKNLTEIVKHRQQRRSEIEQRQAEKGSPLPLNSKKDTGDPQSLPSENLPSMSFTGGDSVQATQNFSNQAKLEQNNYEKEYPDLPKPTMGFFA